MTETTESVAGATKAAIFLMGVGDELSAELLRKLDSAEIRRVTSEIAALEAVAPHAMENVFREFESLTGSGRLFARGGAGFARRLIELALGPESANKLLESPPPPPDPQLAMPEMGIFESAEPRQLAGFLRNENPRTIALVLSNMAPEAGGALFQSLPAEIQSPVAVRMATLERVSPEVLRTITEAIGSKLKAISPMSRSGGTRSLAGVLNNVEPDVAERILSDMEQENHGAANAVRNLMFTFEDVLSIDKQGMKAVVGRIDQKVLTLALKGTGQKMRDHFMQCMSQRASEMLVEDIDALGAVRIRDVQAAQQQVIAVVRELQKDGAVVVGRGGSDEYVV